MERINIEIMLKSIKQTWNEKGVTNICKNWTYARKKLINFAAIKKLRLNVH